MAKYDDSLRVEIDIITKNIRPKVQEIVGSLKEIGKEADKAKEKLASLDKAGVSHSSSEYKEAEAELRKFIDAYREAMHQISSYGDGVHDSLQFDTSKLKDAQKRLQALDDAGLENSSKEYREAEQDLSRLIDTQQDCQKVMDEFDSYTQNAVEGFRNLSSETLKYIKISEEQSQETAEASQQPASAETGTDAPEQNQEPLPNQTETPENAVVSDQTKVELLKQQKALLSEINTLEAANATDNNGDHEDPAAKLDEVKRQLSDQAAEEEHLDQIRVNAVATNDQILQKIERIKELEGEISAMKKSDAPEGCSDYKDCTEALSTLKKDVSAYKNNLSNVPEKFDKMEKSAKKAFGAFSAGTKKSDSLLSMFSSRLKNTKLFSTVFTWMSKAFDAMVSSTKEGFENMAGYSDSYSQLILNMKNALSTFGNQFAAAFAPVVQLVIPWLTNLVNILSGAMARVAQFIVVLGGGNTFIKAKQLQLSYSKSLETTTKAAEKARGALARFDDLDVLELPDNSSGEAGGTGGTEPDIKDMFEEVPVDTAIISWMDEVYAGIVRIKELLAGGFFDGLGDFAPKLASIGDSISGIKNGLVEIWTDPEVLAALWAFVESAISTLGSILGSMASVGLTIATNIFGGIEGYLNENMERIKEYLVSMFDIRERVNEIISGLSESFAHIFDAFAGNEALQLTTNVLGILSDILIFISETTANLTADILNVLSLPIIENADAIKTALEGFLSILESVTGTVKEGLNKALENFGIMYEEHLKPFFDSLAVGLSDTAGKFLEFWNDNVQPILEKWAEYFQVLWNEHLQPILDRVIGLIGDVADCMKAFWENILRPLINWIIENVLPVVVSIADRVVKTLMSKAAVIAEVIGGTIGVFRSIIQFLTDVFTGNWEGAWDGIVGIVESVEDAIKGIVNAILGVVESMANGVVDAINFVIGALNQLSFEIPDWVPLFGGEKFGFDIPKLPEVSIPRLAAGAVIRGGNPFLAVLGDQPAGRTNIEAPLATIEQALENVMSRNGSGGRDRVPVTVNLNYDGETFARLSIPDILTELDRQGYNVDVLGVT